MLLGAYAGLRLGELWISRRHERVLDGRGLPRARDRGFGLMVAAHLAPFVLSPLEVSRARWRPPPRPISAVACVALACAFALRVWTQATLGRRWNVRIHGGAAMDVATSGPYRFVRHPNYLAVIVEAAALPLAGGAYATAVLASILDGAALALRISDEERVLRGSLVWRREMAGKPRLIPRLIPRLGVLPAALTRRRPRR
jgi:methyltransferase